MWEDQPSDRPGWLLDEMVTIGRENVDSEHVARYDEKEDAAAAAEVGLLRSLGLGPASTVVDLGAGTGQFALAATAMCDRVIAVDPSPVMLRQLADKARSSRLQIVRGGFLTYEHRGASADFVYSRYALHHLPDLWKALALGRIRRMLRPGGIFRLWDVVYHFPVDEAEERIERWCASFPVDADGWTRADLEDHVRDEHSTFSWLLEPMIDRARFAIRDGWHSDDGFFAKYVLVAT